MRKPTPQERVEACPRGAGLDPLADSHPRLFERLTDDVWEDGTTRDVDTLFIFHDGARWKCMLKDRCAAAVAFVSSSSFVGLLDALEAGLAASALDWRADRQAKQRKK